VSALRRLLLWNFERGSLPYDIVCLLVLLLIAVTRSSWLGDPMVVHP